KARLSAVSQVEVERLKSDLQRAAYEHQITFAKLHAERAEAIKSIHTKLSDVIWAATIGGDTVTPFNREGFSDFLQKHFNELSDRVRHFRLFLDEELAL